MTGRPGRPLLAVAHRAGNNLADLRAALDAGVDLVETDVHQFRGRLEVRHLKSLGPALLWDRWELARRRGLVLPSLGDVIEALGGDPRLMLDLKGVHRRLAPGVAATLRRSAPDSPIAVCTQHWWMFRAFAEYPHLRLVWSAGSRRGLRRLRRCLADRPVYGVSVHRRLLTPAIVSELLRGAENVLTWPVDTPADLAEARQLGVSGVISKDLTLLREVVAGR